MGEFAKRFPKTSELLEKARAEVFPTYGVGVYHKETITLGYGDCGATTLFDLASLTKVLCTTTLIALAEQKGLLKTDDPIRHWFKDFPDERVHLSHLLNHTSGLPAWLALHAHFHEEKGLGVFDPIQTPPLAREFYEKKILESHQPEQFEKAQVYSDLGFMLLGWTLEKITSQTLDLLFQEWFVKPTGLSSLQYLPVSPDVAPTEDCPWRGHVLRGEVHDDNTFVLGGVAGHAGVFGNTRDVLLAGKLWLDAWHGRDSILDRETVRKFWTAKHLPDISRTLGWDGVTPGTSSTGRYFGIASRGHLGFTGTSLWIDPAKELIVTLLTNRVHPRRDNEKIKAFRPVFHDTLLTELGEAWEH